MSNRTSPTHPIMPLFRVDYCTCTRRIKVTEQCLDTVSRETRDDRHAISSGGPKHLGALARGVEDRQQNFVDEGCANYGLERVERRLMKAQVVFTTLEGIDWIKCVFNTAYTTRQLCIQK